MMVELDLDEADHRRSPGRSAAPSMEEDSGWWGTIVGLGRNLAGMLTGTTIGDSGAGGGLGSFGPGRGFGGSAFPRLGKSSLMDSPDYSLAQVNNLRESLRQIDKRLLARIEDAPLWHKRAQLSAGIKARPSAVISEGTAAILEGNQAALLLAILQFAQVDPKLAPLMEGTLPARERGNLLATIRSPAFEAELHYALHLAFAWRFQDPDIFRQAIDSMRSGYAGEKRPFHVFRETQVVGPTREAGANSIGLMSAGDLPRIRMNVNNFLLRIGGGQVDLVAITRAQFRILLSTHLTGEIAAGLVSSMRSRDTPKGVLGRKWKDIDSFPNLPESERRLASTRRWFETITMEKIREISLSDMFTGQLYRPSFLFSRHDPELAAEISRVKWMNGLDDTDFPGVSDGKPLAQAIYKRFSKGNAEWSEYFRLAQGRRAGPHTKARAQRLLLLLVTEFGPLKEFEKYIEPLVLDLGEQSVWDLYSLTLYTDIYRLSLVFQRKVDEQRLFNFMLNRLPEPPHGWQDFRDAAEHFILCLFLNGSPVRRFQLDRMAERTMRWFDHAVNVARDEKMVDEILTLLSFLEVGTLADLVPENLEQHQFQERRRAIWMEHARQFASAHGFDEWRAQVARSPEFQTT